MLTTKSYLIYRSIHIIPIVTSHVQSHIRSLDAYREIDKKRKGHENYMLHTLQCFYRLEENSARISFSPINILKRNIHCNGHYRIYDFISIATKRTHYVVYGVILITTTEFQCRNYDVTAMATQ